MASFSRTCTLLFIVLLHNWSNAIDTKKNSAAINSSFNPLQHLVLNNEETFSRLNDTSIRVKRQYYPYDNPYNSRRQPVPIILVGGGVGFGGGSLGRFAGRGFSGKSVGRGFGGRAVGRGFGARGIGGRGIGGIGRGVGGGRGRG